MALAPADEWFILAGHSNVRRLSDYVWSIGLRDLGLHTSRVIITGWFNDAYGQMNQNISYLDDLHLWIDQYSPSLGLASVICIDIGGNDIQRRYWCEGEALAHQVYHLAWRLRYLGVRRVALMPIMFRQGLGAVPRWWTDRSVMGIRRAQLLYNRTVIIYNRCLANLCAEGDGTVCLGGCKGLKRRWGLALRRDGVHYTPRATRTYLRNIRSTFIKEALKWP